MGPRTGWAGFISRSWPVDQPVKQNAQSRQVLFDGGRGQLSLQVLNESGDVDRLHGGELPDLVILTPGRKAAGGVQVSPAGVGVVDLSGEELQHALGGLGSGREQAHGLAVPGFQVLQGGVLGESLSRPCLT